MTTGFKLAPKPELNSRSRILLVEDNVYVAKYIRKRLIIEGFEVIETRNGAEALRSLTSGILPDLIISDLSMPEMNGMQLMNAVRGIEDAKSIPILILSGTASVEQRVECLDHGASDYLCKPIDGSELAARVRVHLRNTVELRRLRREARFDPLTGVLNRRGAIEALQRECDRARRSDTALTVMLVDADAFKIVNDTFGHAAGDQVLVEMAAALEECLRVTDVVGRIGGDEFIIALPNVQKPLANAIKKRLRKRVSENIVPGSEGMNVNISIGLVVDTEGNMSLEQLFEEADNAMYADKSRNKRKLKAVSAPVVAAQGFQL